VVSALRSQCPLCCASSRICSPSYAPRGAPIPCGLTRLRILPVTTGVPPQPSHFLRMPAFGYNPFALPPSPAGKDTAGSPAGSQSNHERCNRDA
jgi:hypothetical protein